MLASGAAAALVVAQAKPQVVALLSANLGRAEAVAEDLLFYAARLGLPAPTLRALPPKVEEDAGAFESECDLLSVVATLRTRRESSVSDAGATVIAATPEALMRPCPGREASGKSELLIRPGLRIGLRHVAEVLAKDFDYDHEALCEAPGQFAVRGGIIDVYPLNAHAPVRIDFFGDEVESLRVFDPATQRSEGEPLPLLLVSAPVAESGGGVPGGFFEHLPPETLYLWVDPVPPEAWPRRVGECHRALISPVEERPDWFESGVLPAAEWSAESLDWHAAEPDAAALGLDRLAASERLRSKLLRRLAAWWREGRRVSLVCETVGGAERLREILAEQREDWLTEPEASAPAPAPKPARGRKKKSSEAEPMPVSPAGADTAGRDLADFAPEVLVGRVSDGFALPSGAVSASFGAPQGWVVCTERELFGRRQRRPAALRTRRLPHRSRIEQILDFHELADGDLLVHLRHGVCRYRGITRLELRGVSEEVVSLEFADSVTMHTPLRESHLLSKYVGLSRVLPKLGKIGSDGWQKTRKAAEAATVDLAADLLQM